MARIHGKDGQVMMDADGTSPYAYVEIADLNGWTLDMTRDRQVATAFGDTNVVRVAGLPDFAGNLTGLWNNDSSPTYFDAVLAGVPVALKLLPNRNAATHYFSGLANLDGSVNVSVSGVVTIGGSWDAASNWTVTP